MRRRLAIALAASLLVWLPTPVTVQPVAHAATTCTGWTSTLVPPPTIRVYRTYGAAAGTVQTVDFRAYVENTIYWEYISSWPAETLKAGAVAIKEYGWYYTMHYRGGTATGGCYDVRDDTYDQMYREGAATSASEKDAVAKSWRVTVTRNGAAFLTGYWAGDRVACGANADGIRIYQWSSMDCGRQGYTMEQILTLYYGPGTVVNIPTNFPTMSFMTAPPGRQVTVGTTTSLVWAEDSPVGAGIASRSLTLVSTKPVNGVCPESGWLPVPRTWTNGGASPQTVSNLQPGTCYWLFGSLTDGAGRSSMTRSGAMLVDASAPAATFSWPFGRTVASSFAGSVAWSETPAAGATIAARTVTEETAQAPMAGSCAGATWQTAWQSTSGSPISLTGLGKLRCYRFSVTLRDSAGRTATWYSGEIVTPAS